MSCLIERNHATAVPDHEFLLKAVWSMLSR